MNLSHVTVQTLNKTSNLYTVDNMIIFVNTDLKNDEKTLVQIRNVLRLGGGYGMTSATWLPNTDHPFNKTIVSSNNVFSVYLFHNLVSIVPEYIFDSNCVQSTVQNIEKYITQTIFENLTNNPHVINNIGFKFAYYSPSEITLTGYRKNRDIQVALSGEKLIASRMEYIKTLTVDTELRLTSSNDLMFNLLDFIKLSPDTVCQVSTGLSELFKQITKNVESAKSGSTQPSNSPATISSPFPVSVTPVSGFGFPQTQQPTPATSSSFTFPQSQQPTPFGFSQSGTTTTTAFPQTQQPTPATSSTFTFPQTQQPTPFGFSQSGTTSTTAFPQTQQPTPFGFSQSGTTASSFSQTQPTKSTFGSTTTFPQTSTFGSTTTFPQTSTFGAKTNTGFGFRK